MNLMRYTIFIVVMMVLSPISYAQLAVPRLPQVDQSSRPGDRALDVPSLDEDKSAPKFVLPPVTIPEDYESLSAQFKIFVSSYNFSGNIVIADDELMEVAKAYSDREITSHELEQLRRELTLAYVNKGYINSGVLIPDQKVSGGIIRFEIIEGNLTAVDVSGNERLRSKYIRDRLVIADDEILNVNTLRDGLKLLQQSHLINRVNARLGPGMRRGEAVLDLAVEENKPYSLSFLVNNYRSPSVGSETGMLDFSHINLTGRGDALRATYGNSHGMEELFLSYAYPFGYPETKIEVRYEKSDSLVIEEPFDLIDIESKSETFGVHLSHNFLHSLSEQFSAGIGLEWRSSDTYLLNRPFSFSPGVENGESDVTPIRFWLDWMKRDIDVVYAARSVLSIGLDGLGATSNDAVDSEFLSWLGQFQMVRRLNEHNVQFVFKANVQLTNETLLPMEKFSMGGDIRFVVTVKINMPAITASIQAWSSEFHLKRKGQHRSFILFRFLIMGEHGMMVLPVKQKKYRV